MNKVTFASVLFAVALIFSSDCYSSSNDVDDAIGHVTTGGIKSEFKTFNDNYQTFQLTSEDAERVANWPENINVSVYFGTWCHDSQREVPKLFRIAEASLNVQFSWIALDRTKSDPQSLAKLAGVKFTPTIVVYNNEHEIGRIIERPKVSLVDDLEKIIFTN
ncbi:thioredoxin family protein [Thalassotalea fusca]